MIDSLVSLALFKVNKQESQRVRQWLEQTHYEHMYATGCFETLRIGFLDETGKEQDTIVYVHTFKNEGEQARYEKEHRPTMRAEFGQQFKELLESGALTVSVAIGQTVIHEYTA